jgi:hypothetical protein
VRVPGRTGVKSCGSQGQPSSLWNGEATVPMGSAPDNEGGKSETGFAPRSAKYR